MVDRADGILPPANAEPAVAEKAPPEFDDTDLALAWVLGSMPQLQVRYPGRCIGCGNWSPAKLGNHGDCSAIPDKANNDTITIGSGPVTTKYSYGCGLWSELDPDELEQRTDLAIRRNLLDEAPDDFAPGEALKEAIRERKVIDVPVAEPVVAAAQAMATVKPVVEPVAKPVAQQRQRLT